MKTARIVGLIVLIGTVLALTASARTREANEPSARRSQAVDAMGGTMGQMAGTMGMMKGASMHPQGTQSGMHAGAMGSNMGNMSGHMSHQQMTQALEQQNTQLQMLVERMNGTTGSAKIDAIAKVVTELANRQAAMRQGMMEVQPLMMQHMMEHMNGGMMSGTGSMMSGGMNGHMQQQAGDSR